MPSKNINSMVKGKFVTSYQNVLYSHLGESEVDLCLQVIRLYVKSLKRHVFHCPLKENIGAKMKYTV